MRMTLLSLTRRALGPAVLLALVAGVGFLGFSLKIGFINAQEIISTCEAGKVAAAQLQDYIRPRQEQFQAKRDELIRLGAEYDVLRKNPTDKDFRPKEEALLQRRMQIQNEVQQLSREIQEKEQELKLKLLPEVEKIIRDKGKAEGYTLIIDTNAGRAVYWDESLSLTAQVVGEMNRRFASGEVKMAEPAKADKAPGADKPAK